MNTPTMTYTDAPTQRSSRSVLRHGPTVARLLTGLAFLVFGLNGFLNFIPQPQTPLPAPAIAFVTALLNSGYMMPLIAITQLIAGVMLLSNCFVPLALALLAPFLVNSLAFHLYLERSGLPMALVFVALELYLAWSYRDAFRSMLALRTRPTTRD